MASSFDVKEKLKELGLSDNEVMVYLFLIKRDKCSIQVISKKTNIPRSTIYETLRSLLDKGLIEEVIEHKKKEYKAYPLKILKHNFEEEQVRLEKNIKNLDILENTISSLGVYSTDDFEIRKYSGKAGAKQLLWNSLAAKDTVYVYSYFGRTKYVGVNFYESFVRESKNRQIKERVIINPTQRVIDLFRKDNGTPRARTKSEDVRLIDINKINIQGETLIYNNVFATVYLDREDIVGFEIESKSFVEMQRLIFDANWERAEKLVL